MPTNANQSAPSATNGREAGLSVDELLAELKPVIDRQARHLCHINRVPPSSYFDDVRQLVAIEAWKTIEEAGNGAFGDCGPVPSIEQRMYVRARPKVRSLIDHLAAPASGMVAARRRAREIQRTIDEFDSDGRQVKLGEVIKETNARLQSLVKDAARQSMVVGTDDFYAHTPATELGAVHTNGREVDLDTVTAIGQATQRVLARARAIAPGGSVAARIYLSEAAGPSDPAATDAMRYLARALGVRVNHARRIAGQVRRLAQEELTAVGLGPAA